MCKELFIILQIINSGQGMDGWMALGIFFFFWWRLYFDYGYCAVVITVNISLLFCYINCVILIACEMRFRILVEDFFFSVKSLGEAKSSPVSGQACRQTRQCFEIAC